MPFNNYLSCCGVKKMGLLPRERLRGEDEGVREWGRAVLHLPADLCKTRLLLDCGDVRVCFTLPVFYWSRIQSVTLARGVGAVMKSSLKTINFQNMWVSYS